MSNKPAEMKKVKYYIGASLYWTVVVIFSPALFLSWLLNFCFESVASYRRGAK